jgi:prolipoprotein diacylglyceryl transferase
VPLAVIALSFDPTLRLGDFAVRWETLALAVVIFGAIVLTGLLAGRARPSPAISPAAGPMAELSAPGGPNEPDPAPRRLRRDDMLFILLGIVPGAVIGGRLTYVLLHFDYYHANPGLVFDPSSGGLALFGAVVLGTLTGIYVARLLEAPVGRWLDLAAFGLVIGLGLGKLANVLGATGQGLVSTLQWATAYLGPGPWNTLGPELPAQPAQVYEAIGDGILLFVLLALVILGVFRSGDSRRYLLALGGWAIVRFCVAFTWRDAVVLAGLRLEQLFDLSLLAFAIIGLVVVSRRPATIAEPTPSSPLPVVESPVRPAR